MAEGSCPHTPQMKMELALNSVSAVVAGVSIVMLCLSVMFTHNAHSCYWHQGKRNCDYPPKEVQVSRGHSNQDQEQGALGVGAGVAGARCGRCCA